MRLYRNQLARRVRALDTLKAVASSGAIGAWIVWRDYPLLWSGIIVAAQVADALKGVFPFTKQHEAASDLTVALEMLCIDAEEEWESIYQGTIAAETINKRRTKLRKLQLDVERKHFPEGFDPGQKLVKLAAEEATAYIEMISTAESGG